MPPKGKGVCPLGPCAPDTGVDLVYVPPAVVIALGVASTVAWAVLMGLSSRSAAPSRGRVSCLPTLSLGGAGLLVAGTF